MNKLLNEIQNLEISDILKNERFFDLYIKSTKREKTKETRERYKMTICILKASS